MSQDATPSDAPTMASELDDADFFSPAQVLRDVVQTMERTACTSPPDCLFRIVSLCHLLAMVAMFEDEIGLLYPFLDFVALHERLHAPKASYDRRLGEILCLLLATTAALEDPSVARFADPFVEETTITSRRRTQMDHVEEHDLCLLTVMVWPPRPWSPLRDASPSLS